jgi:hypothetical protein
MSLGVAAGDGEVVGSGEPLISVGVGTGGSSSGGSGSSGADDTGAGSEVTGMLGAETAPIGFTAMLGDTERPGRGGWDGYSLGVSARRAGRSGAEPNSPAPIPPVPSGAPIEAGRRAGVASVQPTTIEIGRPNATSPKKMDLGDNRTPRTPVRRGKRLRLGA